MPERAIRPGNRLMDRPEFLLKQQPLTCSPQTKVIDAVIEMTAKNHGAVVVVNKKRQVVGVVTERDVMKKIVALGLNANETLVDEIMTKNPRLARETDDLIDWLRIMSNERFRRLPVVDENGEIKAVFTQGDFVSYTWPDLMYQMKSIATATVSKNWAMFLIGGGIAIYSIVMFIVFSLIK